MAEGFFTKPIPREESWALIIAVLFWGGVLVVLAKLELSQPVGKWIWPFTYPFAIMVVYPIVRAILRRRWSASDGTRP